MNNYDCPILSRGRSLGVAKGEMAAKGVGKGKGWAGEERTRKRE